MKKENVLWYDSPADLKNWNEALPVGNGRLGAMVFGGADKERIQLNEDSVWGGGFIDRVNSDSFANLEKVRQLIRDGEIEEAQLLAKYAMTGTPQSERNYQTLGDLTLDTTHLEGEITDYRRELDLEEAVCRVSFRCGEVEYTREVFASQPQNVLVIRYRASRPNALNCHVKISRDRFFNTVWKENGNRIAFEGTNGGENGLDFCCMVQGSCVGGTLEAIGEYLVVRNASEALFLLTAATSFREQNLSAYCRDRLAQCGKMTADQLFQEHLAEYQPYFRSCSLRLEESGDGRDLPTDQRLERFRETGEDNGLIALYFHFGRYLLISPSRPGSLPANLQGIWADGMKPAWDSKYTININTEMNYWPAEMCGLSDCHLPLFDHLERMYPHGKYVARTMYHARGWVAHHNTDLWGDCAPQDTYIPATYWTLGAAWLSTHIWEHYAYTMDTDFLKEHFYLLRDACVFFLDHLIEDEKGRLVISPSTSPENTYLLPKNGRPAQFCQGSAMDSQILTELFRDCIAACDVLGGEEGLKRELSDVLEKIPSPKIDSKGRIMEWMEEYEEKEPGHRHISHLYALYPGHQITLEDTPELAQAARKTLEYRLSHGGGHTGWSRAWIINFWAQLRDREKTEENIKLLLIKSTLSNLFDNHPPFQIDGNFGGAAGIARCLMQSGPDRVELLPVLPESWREGQIEGLRARGGLTVGLCWKNSKLDRAEIAAGHAYQGTIGYRGQTVKVDLEQGDTLCLDANMGISVKKKG